MACVVLACASIGQAWIDTGHMVVAGVAYRELKPAVRAEAERLLRSGGDDKTRDFLGAACWADDYKTAENGPWHYINIHFRTDGKPVSTKPLEQNVIWAIERFSKEVSNKSLPETQRADALRFLLHFVGDIHQPMHSVAQDTDAYPEGDRGGNDFKFDPFQLAGFEVRNLHFLWDIGGGLFTATERPLKDLSPLLAIGDRMIKDHPRGEYLEIGERNAAEWAQESFRLARAVAYSTAPKARPSEGYLATCRYVSERRVTLAGYRLADLLDRLLG